MNTGLYLSQFNSGQGYALSSQNIREIQFACSSEFIGVQTLSPSATRCQGQMLKEPGLLFGHFSVD